MQAPPQAGQYGVIYADPPWRFSTYSDKGKGRSAYPGMLLRKRSKPVARFNRSRYKI